MGRQLQFSMTQADAAIFIKELNAVMSNRIKVLVLKDISDRRMLVEIIGNEINNMSGVYYLWNTDFQIDNMCIANLSDIDKLPLIEFFCATMAIPPSGRIYWNSCWSAYYKNEDFNKWYNKCVRLIKKMAVYAYGDAYKTYVHNNSWADYNESILDNGVDFNGSCNDFFTVHQKYNNILLLKMRNKCLNKCSDCKRISNPQQYTDLLYIEAFKALDLSGIEYLLVGVGYDPLTSDCVNLLNYIKKNTDIKIIAITNGLLTKQSFIQNVTVGIDKLYIFVPSDVPEEYYKMTNSKLGLQAYAAVEEFIRYVNRYYRKQAKEIVYNKSRNELYEMICDEYGYQASI